MRYTKICFLQILCLVVLVSANEHDEPKQVKKRGVVENFGQGLKFAGQMFGINTAADVANLVAMAFGNKKPDLMSMFQQKQPNAAEGDSGSDASQQDTDSQEQQASNVKQRHRHKQQQQHKQQEQEHQQQQESDESDEQSREPLNNSEFSTSRFVTGVLRMIGFDATKLGALAINALIMIAQVIGNAFTAPTRTKAGYTPSPTPYNDEDEGVPEAQRNGEYEAHQPRALREGTPIDWYLENPDEGMRRTLNDALDSQLTERITEMIEQVEQQEGRQAGCVKMLMCKSSPIIWGMQRSVSERVTGKKANTTEANAEGSKKAKPKKLFSTDVFFAHFPTLEEFRKHGAVCEERFGKQCNINDNEYKEAAKTEAKEKKPKEQ